MRTVGGFVFRNVVRRTPSFETGTLVRGSTARSITGAMTTAQVVATGSRLGFGWGTEEGEKYEQVQEKSGHCVVGVVVRVVCVGFALLFEWVLVWE